MTSGGVVVVVVVKVTPFEAEDDDNEEEGCTNSPMSALNAIGAVRSRAGCAMET